MSLIKSSLTWSKNLFLSHFSFAFFQSLQMVSSILITNNKWLRGMCLMVADEWSIMNEWTNRTERNIINNKKLETALVILNPKKPRGRKERWENNDKDSNPAKICASDACYVSERSVNNCQKRDIVFCTRILYLYCWLDLK